MRLNSLASARILLFILAILLWLTATLLTQTTRTVEVPISISGLDTSLAIATPITTVTAKIRGRLRDVARIGEDVLSAQLDMSNVGTPGNYHQTITIRLDDPKVQLASTSKVDRDVLVETLVRKTVVVAPIPGGLPAIGFNLAEVTSNPAQVIVAGAPTLLNGISEVTAPIKVKGRRNTFTTPSSVGLEIDGHLTPVITMEPSEVNLTAVIEKGEYNRNLGIQPNLQGNLPTGYWVREVTFSPMTAQIVGNRRVLDHLQSLASTAIELTGRTGDFSDEVSLVLPNGVSIVGSNLFKVNVKISLLASYRQIIVTPEFTGLGEGLNVASANPPTIQAVVSGSPTALADLKAADLHLRLDLKGIVSGSHQVTLNPGQFSLPAGLQVVSFTPSLVDIIISRE